MIAPHQPALTLAALERVRQAHPFAASGYIADTPRAGEAIEALWVLLMGAPGADLVSRIDALTRFELRLILHSAFSRAREPLGREILIRILERRRPEGGERLAWTLFLATDGGEGLAALAQRFAAAEPATRQLYGRLLNSSAPSVVAAREFLAASRLPLESWLASDRVRLGAHQEFVGRVKRRLLSGDLLAETCRRVSSAEVKEWTHSVIPAADMAEWYRDFLQITWSSAGWRPDHHVLETIVAEYGEPDAGSAFWSGVTAPIQQSVMLWIKDRLLTELLGEGERVEFWRRFLVDVRHAEFNVDKAVVLIRFDGWVAVQFKYSGTATYLLREGHCRGIRRYDDVSMQRFVRERRDRPSMGYLGRYAHMGHTWEVNAAAEVRAVMRLVRNG